MTHIGLVICPVTRRADDSVRYLSIPDVWEFSRDYAAKHREEIRAIPASHPDVEVRVYYDGGSFEFTVEEFNGWLAA